MSFERLSNCPTKSGNSVSGVWLNSLALRHSPGFEETLLRRSVEGVPPIAASWGFVADEEMESGHCSRIFANPTQILRVPLPGVDIGYGVDAALKLQKMDGPEVLAYDRASEIMLLERLRPGTTLYRSHSDGNFGEEVFVELALRLRRLDPAGGMPLAQYVEGDPPLLPMLEETTRERCFLHGDLHHANILLHEDRWRPIDAEGLIGDPHYECVAFLRNPGEALGREADLGATTERRILSMAKALGLNPWRIAAWCLVDRHSKKEDDSVWGRLKGIYALLERKLWTGVAW